MSLRTLLAIAVLAASVVSCAAPGGPAKPTAAAPAGNNQATAKAAPARPALPELPNIPKDARWTVFCATLTGPAHAAQAKTLRDQLIQSTGMRDWYIVQGDGQSTLYYGFYREIDDSVADRDLRKEAQRAQADRRQIAALMSPSTGTRLFRAVLLVGLDEPDPSAPAEWDLANAKGFWSLQIGVCKDVPNRKQAAVEAVREARAAGYEAYFYHGPTTSSVCIGAWPESAVVKVTDARSRDPNAVPLLVPGSMEVPDHAMTRDGQPVERVQEKVQIADAALAETMKKFPIQAFNGLEKRRLKNVQTGEVREVVLPSTLVKIPRHEARVVAAPPSGPVRPAPSNAANPAAPTDPRATPGQNAGGRLRSLED